MLKLDPEQTILKDTVSRWLTENVSPIIVEHERNRTFPFEILSDLQRFGYLGGQISEVDGGHALPHVTWGVLMESAGYCWGSLRTLLNITNGAIKTLSRDGTDAQKERFLTPILQNQKKVCVALSEPNVGSDVRSVQTRAVLENDQYVINGRKLWITNGVHADYCLLLAQTHSPDCDGGLSIFVVEKDMPGFSSRLIPKMTLRPTATSELEFVDVKVPRENLIGREGKALSGMLGELNSARVNIATGATGQAQAALDLSIYYAKTRHQFGKPIGSFQLIQKHIVDMTIRTKAARALSYTAAQRLDDGDDAREDCSIAKLYATQAAFEVADMALQVHGGLGYAEDYPIERIFRDTRGGQIPEGTSEVQTLIAGREILGLNAIS